MSEDEQEGLYRVYKDDSGWVYEKFAEMDELRELVEQWQAFAEDIDPIDDMQAQQHTTLTECANELEALINDE